MDLFSSLYSIEFCSLASGSSGNCYYVAHHDGALLIDAGISLRRTEKHLRELGRDMRSIKAILLTHHHIDHIAGLVAIAGKYTINIYASPLVMEAIRTLNWEREMPCEIFKVFEPGRSFHLAGFSITAFEVDHDVQGTVGFHIRNSNSSMAIATDLGHVGRYASAFLPSADILVLEANYDSAMLENGPYPAHLRRRISSSNGHLGNHQAADFVARHCSSRLKHLFLAHLSKENNHPDRVIETFEEAFTRHGFDKTRLENFVCLERNQRSALYRF